MNRSRRILPRSTEERLKSIARVQGIRLPEAIDPERETRWTEERIPEIITTLKPFAKRVPAIASLIWELNDYRQYGDES
ncbi:hypothetical protein V0288_19300 [Pannus brasiliensis CCIBt3594]|uniref:Uncharacterized protein n=1 Tax=Pannus brasiliensis CCIBt3594 TaxID=1427578 RepID=A0AAW9QZR4_9CHRO